MPSLLISTNVSVDGVNTSSILSELSKAVAQIMGKPEAGVVSCLFAWMKYVMVQLKGGVAISFGGSEDPAAYGELVSIGGLSADTNKKLSAAIANVLESKLSVPKSRYYIKFYDVKRSDFGWNGSTF